jgi:hypothetical protein
MIFGRTTSLIALVCVALSGRLSLGRAAGHLLESDEWRNA